MNDIFVIEAARKLLSDDKYQDVSFKCSDGCIVGCNRAFLAATNEYFDILLFGGLLESSATAEIKLQAPSGALRHVLQYLHSGSFTTVDEECCWVILLETCSLAQEYMLPALVQHIAGRLLDDLPAEHLGLALSFALKAQLHLVIKHIWVALPRLLQQPLAFDSTYSAEAICLCLQHTCWMGGPATAAAQSTGTAAAIPAAAAPAAADGAAAAAARPRLWGELSRDGGTADTPAGDSNSSSNGDKPSITEREAGAYTAVIAWMLQDIAGCADCQNSRQEPAGEGAAGSDVSGTSSIAVAEAEAAGIPANTASVQQNQQQQQQQQAVQHTSAQHPPRPVGPSCTSHGSEGSGTTGGSQSSGAMHPGGWTSSSSARVILTPPSDSLPHGPVRYSTSGTAAAGMSRSSSACSEVTGDTPAAAAAAALDTVAPASRGSSSMQRPFSAPPMAQASSISDTDACTTGVPCAVPGGLPESILCSLCGGTGADGAAAARQQQQQHGHCCPNHEAVLLQLLARLNWHLLPHAALEQLESLSLLSPPALLDIYRALRRCSHWALHGSFPACLTATIRREGSGEQGRLRCYTAAGEQVLECDSPAHMTSTATLAFTRGKHCWQFVVLNPCDLVWIGLGDGSLAPEAWGGKQSGGWFYGSNDALCHDKHSEKHAYDKHCGHGPWGPGAVIDVCLDMDAREVWFGVDGAPLKLGFSDLPARVYPAVSLRAPGQLLVRFRASSWLMAAA